MIAPFGEGEVHVWHAAVLHDDGESLSKLEKLLSPLEIDRADRYVTQELRRRSVAGRGILRHLLGDYLRCDPAEIAFEQNQAGKLSLLRQSNWPDIRFNVSHSKDRLIYAISQSREVGIDIESLDRQIEIMEIARSFFAPAESERLASLADDARHRAFFECWTRKEAYIKAVGLGLRIPLDSFELSFGPGEPAKFIRGGEGWFLAPLNPPNDCVAALVVRGEPCQVTEFNWQGWK